MKKYSIVGTCLGYIHVVPFVLFCVQKAANIGRIIVDVEMVL